MFKKLYTSLLQMVVVLMSLTTFSAYASSSSIDTIDIKVVIDTNGTASIKEYWHVNINEPITEWYLAMKNLGEMSISDFRVYDHDKQQYLVDDSPWDIDRSIDEKAGKYGINTTDEGYELCWGIGTREEHRWTAEYKLVDLVKKYYDGCGFNHCFVNYDLSSGPKYARITISMADSTRLDQQNARIWAFRYHGTCLFKNGNVVAETTEEMTTENSMVVMCIFPNLDFNTNNIVKDTIGTMKWLALRGSDYLDNYNDNDYANGNNVLFKDNEDCDISILDSLLLVIIVIGGGGLLYGIGYVLFALGLYMFAIILWNIISLRPIRIFTRQRKLLKSAESPYFRNVPLEGDLNRAFYIMDANNYRIFPQDPDNLIAAYIVRMMKLGVLSIVSTEENGKFVSRIKITGQLSYSNKFNKSADKKAMLILLNIMKDAAGKNFILEKGELKQYLKQNNNDAHKLISAIAKENTTETTPHEYQEVIGLKKFLKDFSKIETRGAVEVALWDEYLVYASLYGMADQVIKDFKKVCPDYFTLSKIGSQLVNESGHVVSGFNSFTGISSISHRLGSVHNSSSSSSSYSGGGGRSSSGGGGGSSGGGGGGGGR